MRNILFFMLIGIFFFSISCERDTSAFRSEKYNSISFVNSQGIYLSLDSIKSNYTLDENIKGNFIIRNITDTSRIHILTNHGPLYHFAMYNDKNEKVNFQPSYITQTYYDFYFEPGDEFSYKLDWQQDGFIFGNLIEHKVFSGRYSIHPTHVGISTQDLQLWVEISEEGNPISTYLYYDFTRHDSLIVDCHFRNRVSKSLNYELNQWHPIEINYLDPSTGEIVQSHHPDIEISDISLNPKSDLLIYHYKISRVDDLLSNLNGSYRLQINFNAKSCIISAETRILL